MRDVLQKLERIIVERKSASPDESYTAHLFAKGAPLQARKIVEEAGEVITATSRDEVIAESADLLFHLCVYLVASGISIRDVFDELEKRMK